MKIVILGHEPNQISVVADSALGRDAMPFFIPPFGQPWAMQAALALRVGRLGKNVAAKFALRYIDAIAPLALASPATPEPWLSIMDSAATAGEWQPVDEASFPDSASITAACASSEARADLEALRQAAADAIVRATAYATVKTGDIIVPPLPRAAVPIAAGDLLQASLLWPGASPSIRLKIR